MPATASRELTVPKIPSLTPPVPPLRHELGGTAWIGLFLIILFFVIGGGWAATAPLSGAAIADGVVSPAGSRQTVQHLEGGIIREIKVSRGDVVEEGQPLVVLEDIRATAEYEARLTRLRALAAAEARLLAVRLNTDGIEFDHPSLADRDDPEVRALIEQQRSQFRSARESDATRTAILGQRIAQLEEQIVGTERQLVGVRKQLALIKEEIADVSGLVREGLALRPRLLELQRREAGTIGEEGELMSRIARAREQIGETRMQIINLRTTRVEDADAELTEVQAQRVEVETQIAESFDKLTRTVITAPVAGTILEVHFKTTGGVIRPGEPVLDIVPAEDELIIDAKLSPNDKDDVYVGLTGHVTFPSYPQRHMPRIPAELTNVSADAFEDERTGASYYTAKVTIDRAQLRELAPQVELTPGLPATVFIETSERTALDYILDPIWLSIEQAFREH